MARRPGHPRKAKPTTVRLEEPLDRWVRYHAMSHPDGQSGVLNDAVRLYRAHIDAKGDRIYDTIVGNGHAGSRAEEATDAH